MINKLLVFYKYYNNHPNMTKPFLIQQLRHYKQKTHLPMFIQVLPLKITICKFWLINSVGGQPILTSGKYT